MASVSEPVSVIIPYCEDFTPRSMLNEAIESVRSQTIPTNIIVVNDPNKNGPAWARNKGLDQANTRYVAFLDADDLWKSQKLEKQVSEIQHQKVGMCIEATPDMNTDTFIEKILLGSLDCLTSSILIDTRQVNVRFDEEMYRYEDHLFIVEAAAATGVCFCEDLIIIRRHDRGLTASESTAKSHKSYQNLISNLESNPITAQYTDVCRQRLFYSRGRLGQLEGDNLKGIFWLLKSLRYGINVKTIGALTLSPIFIIRNIIYS